jgi:peptidoglycan L-alanyl-D-glutamate endopeptidase CwlK
MSKYKFGPSSLAKLETCDPRLQLVMKAVLAQGIMDMSVTEGHRDQKTQDRYFAEKKSRVKFPNGKHNSYPSMAVDVAPYVGGFVSYDTRHCCHLAGLILGIAASLGVKLRWGGNWDMDGEPITDQDFQDLVHYELIDKE